MNDKMMLWGSVLGMITIPVKDFYFQIGNADGTWNWEKLNDFMWNIANRGANGFREFGPWIDAPGMEKLSPWLFDGENFNLFIFNEQYFENLENMVKMAKSYNLDFCIDILNSSETRVENVKEWTPWKRNVQNLKNYFYDNDSSVYRINLAKKYVYHLKKYPNVLYQICNEPGVKGADYLLDVYETLINEGIEPGKILTGLDPLKKGTNKEYDKFYRDFRNGVKKRLGNKAESWVKEVSWSAIHKASVETINEYFNEGLDEGDKVPSNPKRCMFYSDDGLRLFYQDKFRPLYKQTYESSILILKTKKDGLKNFKLGRELIVGKRESEVFGEDTQKEYRGLEGSVEAYKDFTGEYPYNKGRFPEKLPLPDYLKIKEPEVPETPVEVVVEEPKKEEEKPMNIKIEKKDTWKWVVSGVVILIPTIIGIVTKTWWITPVAIGLQHILYVTKIIKVK